MHFAKASALCLYQTRPESKRRTLMRTSYSLSSSSEKGPLSVFMSSPRGHVHSTWLAFDTILLHRLHSLYVWFLKKKNKIKSSFNLKRVCGHTHYSLMDSQADECFCHQHVWYYWCVCSNRMIWLEKKILTVHKKGLFNFSVSLFNRYNHLLTLRHDWNISLWSHNHLEVQQKRLPFEAGWEMTINNKTNH